MLLLALAGCGSKPHRTVNSDVLEETQSRTQVEQAVDMLARIEELDRGPALVNVIANLNNHLAEQQPDPKWEPDPLVARLPQTLRQTLPPLSELKPVAREELAEQVKQKLGQLEIVGTDALYVEEALMLRDIGRWVVAQTPPKDIDEWLESREAELGQEAAQDLRAAWLLFDWSVRNIQLDHMLPPPADVVGPTGGGTLAIPAPLRGVAGPGYMAYPWYTAMTGHGDAWQRGRMFILLARQRNIDVVMLAMTDSKDAGKTTPWACGALIGNALYLFDPALGLPIAGPEGKGVATLAQVRENDELLRAHDIDDEHKYSATATQAKNVTALVDASLEALSQRMQLLEADLAGERQLRLSVRPSELAAKLRKNPPGVANVAIWNVPIETSLFEYALRYARDFDPQLRGSYLEERVLLEQPTQFAAARYKHLRGRFLSTLGDIGAKEIYVKSRMPDADIDSLDHNLPLQRQQGLAELIAAQKTPEQRKTLVEGIQARMRRGKQDCSYWLGLAHYETGDYDDAVSWFNTRTLKASGENWWEESAHLNLGRAYERLNAQELAKEQYLAVEGPQQLGALVRAKRIAGE